MKLFQLNSTVWAFLDDEEKIWFNLKGVEKLLSGVILPVSAETLTWTNLCTNFNPKHQNYFTKETVFILNDYLNCDAWVEEIMEVYEVLKTGKNSFFRMLSSNIYLCYYDDCGRVTNIFVFLNTYIWFEAKKLAILFNYANSDRFLKTLSNCSSWFHLSNGSKFLPENTMFINEFNLCELLVKPTRKHVSFQFKIWILQEVLPYFHSLKSNLKEPPAKKMKFENNHFETTLNEIKSSLNEIKENNYEIVKFYKEETQFKSRDFFKQFVEETSSFSNIQKPFTLIVFRVSENEFKILITYKENIETVLSKMKNEIPDAILIYLKSNIFNTLPFIINFLITELKTLVSLSKIVKDSIFVNCNIPQLTNALDKIINELRNM